MELRSGSLIASGTGFTSAEQARAACMGQARVQLAPQHRPAFELAVRGVMLRWTALRLAVENEWGGEGSDARAAELEQSILGWFYAKGAPRVHCSCVRASATGRAKAGPRGGALTTAAATVLSVLHRRPLRGRVGGAPGRVLGGGLPRGMRRREHLRGAQAGGGHAFACSVVTPLADALTRLPTCWCTSLRSAPRATMRLRRSCPPRRAHSPRWSRVSGCAAARAHAGGVAALRLCLRAGHVRQAVDAAARGWARSSSRSSLSHSG